MSAEDGQRRPATATATYERMEPVDETARILRMLETIPPTLGGGSGGFHSAWQRLTRDQQRALVFLRDDFRCALSGTETDLLLHHLYPDRDESRMGCLIVLNRWWHTDHHERLRAGDPDEQDIATELRAIADARSREVERWLAAVWGTQ